ncbi:MAG: hypothetical protein JWO13_1764 [Acidobacteriales bacterium]|nr:hypothetical protein [Terriglobales bacterium]
MSRNFELMRRTGKNPMQKARENGHSDWQPMPSAPSDEPESREAEHSTDWQRIATVLSRNWRYSVAFAAFVIIAVALATFLMKPVYEPSARIEVDPPGTEAFSLEGGERGANEAEFLETSAQNLQSEELGIAVVKALGLDGVKEMSGSEGTSSEVGITGLTPQQDAALKNVRANLKVKRDAASRLITVSFSSHDPKLSADVLNKTIQLFIERSYRTRLESIQQSTEWLSRQLDDVRQKMEASNRALGQFQSSTGIADLDDNRNTLSEQLGELNKQKAQAQTERIQIGSILNKVNAENAAELPQAQSNPVVQNLTQKLAEVKAELSQSAVVYGKNHPNVKKLQNQSNELEAQLNAQRTSILGSLKTSYSASQTREQAISGAMKRATHEATQMARYSALKKEAQADVELYNALYRRIKEAGIAAGSRSSGIRIIDAGRVLDRPTRPQKALNLALGIFAGLIGGIFIAFIREAMNDKIHTPEDVMMLSNSSSISIIPQIASGSTFRPKALFGASSENHPDKFLLDRPRSPESEALRGLQTSLMLSRRNKPPQVVLVASSVPGEGKTTVAMNLALALAQTGKTCLVEADLRKPGVASEFGVEAGSGLAGVLRGLLTLDEALVEVPGAHDLTMLPAGPVSANPESVCSESMNYVIRALRLDFRYIVVDSPPILLYPDARALATFVDGIVIVGRSGVTTRGAIRRSISLLNDMQAAPVLDVVLNGMEYVSREYGYYYA